MKQTHTYAILGVSKRTYDEIRAKLAAAGYQHALQSDIGEEEVIDMNGIALGVEAPKKAKGDCRLISAITYFCLSAALRRGSPPDDGGHLFDTEIDLREGDLVVGSSMACSRCGLASLDWTLMRPIPPRNETLVTCPQCEYGEADGDIVEQCEACKRANDLSSRCGVRRKDHEMMSKYHPFDGERERRKAYASA